MEIKYQLVFAENIEEELDFFARVLGFEFIQHTRISSNLEVSILKAKNDRQLMAVTSLPDYRSFKSITVLHSDNCLKDYYLIKNSGVNIIRNLHYNPNGLVVEFADRFDNLFILLEERDYNLTN